MDDISKRRLDAAIAEGNELMDGLLGSMKQGFPVDALNAELSAVGVPPAADLGHAWHWIGYVIGNMVSHGCSSLHCEAVLDAISGLTYTDSYDICSEMGVADALDGIADVTEHDAERVYRWARFMRVGVCEIVFALEDHFAMLGEHPGTANLQERALSGVFLMIRTLHPAFSQAQ